MRRVLVAIALSTLAAPHAHAAPPFNSPFNPAKKKPAPKLPSGKAKPKAKLPPPRNLSPSCEGRVQLSISGPIEVRARLSRGDNDFAGGAHTEVEAQVRHTKRRVFVEGQLIIQEKHPQHWLAAKPKGGPALVNGDTRFAGSFQLVKEVPVPRGCEIATVTPRAGSIRSDPHGDRVHTVYGDGVLDQARCKTNNSRQNKDGSLSCFDMSFQAVEVSFRRASVDCRPVLIEPPTSAIHLQTRVEGDAEMDGHRPHVHLDSTVARSGERLTLRTTLRIREDRSDWTTFQETQSLELFDADTDAPGCRIRAISPQSGRLRGQTGRQDEHRGTVFGTTASPNEGPAASGLIDHAWCRTDANGPDARRLGCSEIDYRAITIQLEAAR